MSKYSKKEKMKKIVNDYFAAWNKHDLVRLKKLFDEKIELKDWEIYEIGIVNVLKANSNIFKSLPTIRVDVIDIAFSLNKVMAEIKVVINKGEIIDVIDIFEIEDGLIKKIKAFKC